MAVNQAHTPYTCSAAVTRRNVGGTSRLAAVGIPAILQPFTGGRFPLPAQDVE